MKTITAKIITNLFIIIHDYNTYSGKKTAFKCNVVRTHMIRHAVHSKMAVTHLPAPLLYKCQRKLLSCEDELGLRRSSVVMLGLANGIWLQVSNWLL